MSTTKTQAKPLNIPDWQGRALSEHRVKRVTVPMDPQPEHPIWRVSDIDQRVWLGSAEYSWATDIFCPHPPGSQVYFREAWAPWIDNYSGKPCAVMGYRAEVPPGNPEGFGVDDPWWVDVRWEPASRMPRWAARHWRTVSACSPRRLGDISEEEARAEGYMPDRYHDGYIEEPPTCYAALAKDWERRHGVEYPSATETWIWDVHLETPQESAAAGDKP